VAQSQILSFQFSICCSRALEFPLLPLFAAALTATAAEPPTNPPPSHFLLIDRHGKAIPASTNDVHSSLHPPPTVGLQQQIPIAPKGAPLADEVLRRIAESKAGQEGLQFLPATPPVLMPYLGNLDEEGNTAIQPGPLLATDPPDQFAQAAKYWLSGLGLRYAFFQSLTVLGMSRVASGSSALQYYTADFLGKWAIFEAPLGGTAGWLSTEANVRLGLSPASRAQTPQGNLASITNPNATVNGPNGIWLSELAWQQSLLNGRFVIVAGLVDQSNYLDANAYANNSQGQFLNSALVNSAVLPLPYNNLGLNLQWQPNQSWYLMFGTGANNQQPGNSPFDSLTLDNWSWLLELGLTPRNFLGLGSGAYRLQPFLATVNGQTQGGVAFNLQQQLGRHSPFGYFGRFGLGGSRVTLDGASVQIATGLGMQAPLKYAFNRQTHDYLGAAFIWSQPSAVLQPSAHANEYGFEAFYAFQLTPLVSVQPDLQVIWDPVNHPNASHNFIFQVQLNLAW
jgi:porin